MSHPDASAESLDRIRAADKVLGAFVALAAGSACPPGDGALSGMTVAVKDVIDVAGFPTRNGSLACRDAPPRTQDAAVVAALRAAGAMILGKTTTTEFAFTDPTPCRNPHATGHSPGGSSSGSGAAAGAGLVDLALGTQTAGSLCRPAAYCGAVGFKPSLGRLPTTGMTPLAPSFDTIGFIARDIAAIVTAMAVADPGLGRPASSSPPHRIATLLPSTEVAAGADQAGALSAAQAACVEAGHDVVRLPDRTAEAVIADHRCVMVHEAALHHAALLAPATASLLRPNFAAALREGTAIAPETADAARARLSAARAAFWAEMAGIDAILSLPVPEPAPPLGSTTGHQNMLTPWTVFGGPLIALPWGRDPAGRPLSVLLAGRPGEDHALLDLAATLLACAPANPRPRLPSAETAA